MPVFDMIESFLVKKLHFTPGRPLRIIARSTYVGKHIYTHPLFPKFMNFFSD